MKLLSALLLLSVLSVSFSASLTTSAKQKVCVKVKTKPSVMRSKKMCDKPKRVRTMIVFDISIPPFSFLIKITLKCFKKKRAVRVTKRDIKCIKVFLKRCRCVPDAEKAACVLDKFDQCAPQADREILPAPTAMS